MEREQDKGGRSDPQEARRVEILDAGLRVLAREGWKRASMNAIAREAQASKETLYNWFGDRNGFFAALIRRNAGALIAPDAPDVAGDTGGEGDDEEIAVWLDGIGQRLLTLLLGETSVTLNRAAIASVAEGGDLAAILFDEGRGQAMARIEARLQAWADQGRLSLPEGEAAAAEDWLALLKGDVQLMALLGQGEGRALSEAEIVARAQRARRLFLQLYGG